MCGSFSWCDATTLLLHDMMSETNRFAFITHFIRKLSIIIFHVHRMPVARFISPLFLFSAIFCGFSLCHIINAIMSSIQLDAFNALDKPLHIFRLTFQFFVQFLFLLRSVLTRFSNWQYFPIEKFVLKEKQKIYIIIFVAEEVMENIGIKSLKGIGNSVLVFWKACNKAISEKYLNLRMECLENICICDIIWYLNLKCRQILLAESNERPIAEYHNESFAWITYKFQIWTIQLSSENNDASVLCQKWTAVR